MSSPTTRVPPRPTQVPVVSGAGITHRGRVRDVNEDAILTDPGGTLWAISDGMGGHGHGDVASDVVIDSMTEVPEDGSDPADQLRAALTAANIRVRDLARRPGFGAMGATVVAAFITGAVAHVAWVGDSRAYILRRGRLGMLTHDHSVVQDLVDQGALSPEQAEIHPESHVITRAIGGAETVDVDVVAVPLTPGDRILLCSDGLTRAVHEPAIATILDRKGAPDMICRDLLEAALSAGAPDNVSAIVLSVEGG